MSLLFCLSKSRIEVGDIKTQVKVQIVRNDRKRLRVGKAEVVITPELTEEGKKKAARCLDLFEDFCTVTAAVREGFEIDVKVAGIDG
jgi:organic hydroperoxide reductase OsmC/OhrA